MVVVEIVKVIKIIVIKIVKIAGSGLRLGGAVSVLLLLCCCVLVRVFSLWTFTKRYTYYSKL